MVKLWVHSLGISGFELGPHYCQLPVADEVQPDQNSCQAVLTVVWFVLDSNYTRQTSDRKCRCVTVSLGQSITDMYMQNDSNLVSHE